MIYFYRFAASFIISFISTPLIRHISIKTGKVAEVKNDRWHTDPKALMGGIAIWLAWTICSLPLTLENKTILIILAGGAAIFFLGLIDDIYGMPPQFKLIGQIIIATTMVSFGLVIEIIPYPVLAIPFTIFWIIGITNSFNLLDNMDGLSSGIATISALAMSLLFLKNNNMEFATLSIILAGSCLGFLYYNFNPATIFMGDCGSMLLGFLLACLTILGTWIHASNLITTIAVPLLVLGIPIFDTTFVTLTRKLSGKPISQGGKDHISHRLVYLGLSEKKTVLILYIFSGGLAGISIYYNKVNPLLLVVLSIILAVILYCIGLSLKDTDKEKNEDIYLKRKNSIVSKKRITEILIDIMLITSSYFIAYILRYDGEISDYDMTLFVDSLPWIITIKLIIFSYMGLYKSLWKYVGMHDAMDIIKAVLLSSFVIITIIFMSPARFEGYSRAIFIIDSVFSIIFIGGTRFIMLAFREFILTNRKKGKKILIAGAGHAGAAVLREIRNNISLDLNVVGFIDDDSSKINTLLHGVPVLGDSSSINRVAEEFGVSEVIIAMPSTWQKINIKNFNSLQK